MSFFETDQGISVLERVIELTRDGTLQWKPSPNSPQYRFITALPRFGIMISSRDNDDVHPFVVTLYSGKSEAVADQYETNTETSRGLTGVIEELYRAAKANAHGTLTLAEDLAEDLDSVERSRYSADDAPF